jgi:hypothetical protein
MVAMCRKPAMDALFDECCSVDDVQHSWYIVCSCGGGKWLEVYLLRQEDVHWTHWSRLHKPVQQARQRKVPCEICAVKVYKTC